jgi:hypothetical protein
MCIILEYAYPLIFLLLSGFILLGTEGGRMDRNERFDTNSNVYKRGISGFTRGIQLYLKVSTDTQ